MCTPQSLRPKNPGERGQWATLWSVSCRFELFIKELGELIVEGQAEGPSPNKAGVFRTKDTYNGRARLIN